MSDYQNYQKDGCRESLIEFARKGSSSPRGPIIDKAQKHLEVAERNRWFFGGITLIFPVIMIVLSKKFDVEYDIIGYPLSIIWTIFGCYTTVHHRVAYLAVEKANGRCHLDAEDEYENKYGSSGGD
jgi:hypothetical protein